METVTEITLLTDISDQLTVLNADILQMHDLILVQFVFILFYVIWGVIKWRKT